MKRTAQESTSIYDVEFVDAYCGSVHEGPRHFPRGSADRSPSTAVGVVGQRDAQTVMAQPPTTAIINPTVLTGTCHLPIASSSIAGEQKPAFIHVESTTVGESSSVADSSIGYRNVAHAQPQVQYSYLFSIYPSP